MNAKFFSRLLFAAPTGLVIFYANWIYILILWVYYHYATMQKDLVRVSIKIHRIKIEAEESAEGNAIAPGRGSSRRYIGKNKLNQTYAETIPLVRSYLHTYRISGLPISLRRRDAYLVVRGTRIGGLTTPRTRDKPPEASATNVFLFPEN